MKIKNSIKSASAPLSRISGGNAPQSQDRLSHLLQFTSTQFHNAMSSTATLDNGPGAKHADALFRPAARQAMREEIGDYGGAEIFFIGHVDAQGMIERVQALGYGNARTVPALLSRVRPGDVAIHNHPSGYLAPSDNDLNASAEFGNRGAGSYIVNNEVTAVRVVVKPELSSLDRRSSRTSGSAASCLATDSSAAPAPHGHYTKRRKRPSSRDSRPAESETPPEATQDPHQADDAGHDDPHCWHCGGTGFDSGFTLEEADQPSPCAFCGGTGRSDGSGEPARVLGGNGRECEHEREESSLLPAGEPPQVQSLRLTEDEARHILIRRHQKRLQESMTLSYNRVRDSLELLATECSSLANTMEIALKLMEEGDGKGDQARAFSGLYTVKRALERLGEDGDGCNDPIERWMPWFKEAVGEVAFAEASKELRAVMGDGARVQAGA